MHIFKMGLVGGLRNEFGIYWWEVKVTMLEVSTSGTYIRGRIEKMFKMVL